MKPAGGKTGFMEGLDMVRDFSQVKKEELYKALDLIDDREWKPFMEWCGGSAAEFGV